MRLYDEILATRGSFTDALVQGALTTFSGYLEQAQCFALSDPIANICAEVSRSKPSSILSALDMIRAPYPYTWVEWSATRPYSVANDKPVPEKLGCLLMTNAAGSKGHFMFAWVHGQPDPGVTVNPLGLIFDWDTRSTEPVIVQYGESRGMKREAVEAAARKRVEFSQKPITPNSRWARFSQSPAERQAVLALEMRAELMPVECFTPFLVDAKIGPGHPIYENYAQDLAGELAFIQAFLLLLNSRNTIVEQRRDNFTRLNKARAKGRKPPLKEFTTTHIRLNRVQSNRAAAFGSSPEAVRAHLCRGHWKLRRSGLYWWSAHMRGKGAPLPRQYEVK